MNTETRPTGRATLKCFHCGGDHLTVSHDRDRSIPLRHRRDSLFAGPLFPENFRTTPTQPRRHGS